MTSPSVNTHRRKSLNIWRQSMVFFTLIALGGHLSFLQVVAWTGMVIIRTPEQGFSQAFASTFSGNQPCCVCDVVKHLQASEDHDSQDPDRPAPNAPLEKIVKQSLNMINDDHVVIFPCVEFFQLTPAEPLLRLSNDAPEPPVPPPRPTHT
jgi:hypothetical protein